MLRCAALLHSQCYVMLPELGKTMGITIFASGKIESTGDIPRLIDDLKRVAGEHNWGYHVIDDDFAAHPDAVLTRRDSGDQAAVIEGSLGAYAYNIDKRLSMFEFSCFIINEL